MIKVQPSLNCIFFRDLDLPEAYTRSTSLKYTKHILYVTAHRQQKIDQMSRTRSSKLFRLLHLGLAFKKIR